MTGGESVAAYRVAVLLRSGARGPLGVVRLALPLALLIPLPCVILPAAASGVRPCSSGTASAQEREETGEGGGHRDATGAGRCLYQPTLAENTRGKRAWASPESELANSSWRYLAWMAAGSPPVGGVPARPEADAVAIASPVWPDVLWVEFLREDGRGGNEWDGGG